MKGRQDAPPPARRVDTSQGVQLHGHDAQTAGRKIQRIIAAMTADVGIVRIQDTRIFPSMDHWTCLQPSDASATAVTAPIWQCVVCQGVVISRFTLAGAGEL